MSETPTPQPMPAGKPVPSEDELLDEALKDTFPASDPVETDRPEKLPPEHPPGSDVR